MLVQDFDIIIVGGGTAGSVLASRLSAIFQLRILLLEAGGNHNDDLKVQTPFTSRRMFGDPEYDWNLETDPQPFMNKRVIQQTRGRMLGGSSAINSHSLVFPNKEMHDVWARMIEDDRWSWEQMKDCYSRFFHAPNATSSNGVHDGISSCGPIKSTPPQQLDELQRAWEEVFATLKLKSENDGPSGRCFGGFTTTNAIDSRPGRGERSHAGNAYLQPILGRSNLVVMTNTLVTRLIFRDNIGEPSSVTVVGIEYEKDNQKFVVEAKREVILSAGVFGSPQLLELSGVGAEHILQPAGIKCLVSLPGVGEYLQDHINFGPSIEVNPNVETMDESVRDPELMANHHKQYLQNRTGPLAEGAAYSFAFWPLQLFNTPSEEERLKLLLDKSAISKQNKARALHKDFIHRMILSPDEASATVFMTRIQRYTTPESRAEGNYMTIIAMLSHPLSVGSTHIKSADPHIKPKIDCGYMSHPLDHDVLAQHCLQIERLVEQPVYRDIIKPNGRRLPRGYGSPFKSLEDVRPAIASYGATNYHPCGTCAMLPLSDGGVVNGDLRVYGTSNLRICDASIFPIIPRGNILTTVYAVAEKLSEIMTEEYASFVPED